MGHLEWGAGGAAGGAGLGPKWAPRRSAHPRRRWAKLQNDVREQRQLIIQMMQTEQQRYDMLLRLLQGQGGGTPLAGLAVPPAAASEPPTEAASDKQTKKSTAAAADRRPGSIEGKVTVTGGSIEDVYVYVEKREDAAQGTTRWWRSNRRGGSFVPRVAVVQTGTNLMFPNNGCRLSQCFLELAPQQLRPRHLSGRRKGAFGHRDRSRGGRHLLQYSSKDVGQGPRRAERALRQGSSRRIVPHRERPPPGSGVSWPGAPRRRWSHSGSP